MAMERAHSVPSNPFYSERQQREDLLRASRPSDLPLPEVSMDAGLPVMDRPYGPPMSYRPMVDTGKGRGNGSVAEMMGQQRQALPVPGGLRSEGRMPGDDVMPGEDVKKPQVVHGKGSEQPSMDDDIGLQRALEVEVVNLLREQNQKLQDEVTFLRGQMEQRSGGTLSSPWSAVTALNGPEVVQPPKVVSSGSNGSNGQHRIGRDGSRTPRSKIRMAVDSPPRVDRANDKAKYTPNCTRVPDGSPPDEVLPPVPPLPHVEPVLGNGFDAALYEPCESKPCVKNGDVSWQPQQGFDRSLSAREAKQVWIERETRSFREALDRLEIPPSFRNSPYWKAGFDPSQQRGGSQHRLAVSHGDLCDQGRALQHDGAVLGEHRDSGRAVSGNALLGDQRAQVRVSPSSTDLGGQPVRARAFASTAVHGGVCQEDPWAGSTVLGPRALPPDVPGQDRAGALHGSWNGPGLSAHDRGRSCDLPRHDGGGGCGGGNGTSMSGWSDSYGATANTKSELPDLLEDASPIHFGDWVHLCGPTMRDLSGVASRWWELTLREAKAYYATWKESTPLQRVQLQVRLPDELHDSRYMRTEQRGIQLLLKAVPPAEQQALVVERALSSTAILYRLMVRFQPGGAGEKQILLQHLTNIPKVDGISELANGLRSWRRHFGRAAEVGATLPDGVLLLKALDVPLQQVAAMDAQASFRLAQSRVHLALDERPTHESLWAFSQCLLAEAETLALLQTSSTATGTPSTPPKLKPLMGPTASPPASQSDSKQATTATKPCKFFYLRERMQGRQEL